MAVLSFAISTKAGEQQPVNSGVQWFYGPAKRVSVSQDSPLKTPTFLPPEERGVIILVVFSGVLNQLIYPALLEGHLVKCKRGSCGAIRSILAQGHSPGDIYCIP